MLPYDFKTHAIDWDTAQVVTLAEFRQRVRDRKPKRKSRKVENGPEAGDSNRQQDHQVGD